jgi:hypothetical protein
MRIAYVMFVFSALMLSPLLGREPARLKAPGGSEFSQSQRVAYYFSMGVMMFISGWFSAKQLKKDFRIIRRKLRRRKRDEVEF